MRLEIKHCKVVPPDMLAYKGLTDQEMDPVPAALNDLLYAAEQRAVREINWPQSFVRSGLVYDNFRLKEVEKDVLGTTYTFCLRAGTIDGLSPEIVFHHEKPRLQGSSAAEPTLQGSVITFVHTRPVLTYETVNEIECDVADNITQEFEPESSRYLADWGDLAPLRSYCEAINNSFARFDRQIMERWHSDRSFLIIRWP